MTSSGHERVQNTIGVARRCGSRTLAGLHMVLLLAKLFVAPTFVVCVTLVGRRLGPRAAGLLAALPVVGGPILGLIVAEQGARFGVRAAYAGAIGAASTMFFAVVYAHAARRLSEVSSLVVAYAAWGLATCVATLVPVSLFSAIVIPFAAWWLAMRAFPVVSADFPAVAPSRWDLPVRAIATMALVLLVTSLADALGPELAGLVTPIPISTAVLAVFTRREAGVPAATLLLRALVRGLASFVSFFLVTGLMLSRTSVPLAFAAGLAFALVLQALVVRFRVGAYRG
jgi:hypothetical protein